jgi:hypothetical protein
MGSIPLLEIRMRSVGSVVIVLAVAAGVAPPIHAQVLTEAEAATLPAAGFEDHVAPIGRVEDGVLRSRWRPVRCSGGRGARTARRSWRTPSRRTASRRAYRARSCA